MVPILPRAQPPGAVDPDKSNITDVETKREVMIKVWKDREQDVGAGGVWTGARGAGARPRQHLCSHPHAEVGTQIRLWGSGAGPGQHLS